MKAVLEELQYRSALLRLEIEERYEELKLAHKNLIGKKIKTKEGKIFTVREYYIREGWMNCDLFFLKGELDNDYCWLVDIEEIIEEG